MAATGVEQATCFLEKMGPWCWMQLRKCNIKNKGHHQFNKHRPVVIPGESPSKKPQVFTCRSEQVTQKPLKQLHSEWVSVGVCCDPSRTNQESQYDPSFSVNPSALGHLTLCHP